MEDLEKVLILLKRQKRGDHRDRLIDDAIRKITDEISARYQEIFNEIKEGKI